MRSELPESYRSLFSVFRFNCPLDNGITITTPSGSPVIACGSPLTVEWTTQTLADGTEWCAQDSKGVWNSVFIELDRKNADGSLTKVADLAGLKDGREVSVRSCKEGSLTVDIPDPFPVARGSSSGTFDIHIHSISTSNDASSRAHPNAISEFTFSCFEPTPPPQTGVGGAFTADEEAALAALRALAPGFEAQFADCNAPALRCDTAGRLVHVSGGKLRGAVPTALLRLTGTTGYAVDGCDGILFTVN